MTAHLPASLLSLFAPRPPLPPLDQKEKPKLPAYAGIAQYVNLFQDPTNEPKPTHYFERKLQRKERKRKERLEKQKSTVEDQLAKWDPTKDSKVTGDPFKTLIVARLNFNTSEHKLKREMEHWGPVKRVRIIQDLNGKPKGYAFVEYEREKDARLAYREADGRKIDGKRVLVDMERGRTQFGKGWVPRRLGGGKGYTRAGPPEINQKFTGRDRRGEEGEDSRPPRDRSPEHRRDFRDSRPGRPFDNRGDRGDRDRGDRGDRGDYGRDYRGDRGGRDRGDRGDRVDRGDGQRRERERDRVGSERERERFR